MWQYALEIARYWKMEDRGFLQGLSPAHRIGTPSEIADAVLYLEAATLARCSPVQTVSVLRSITGTEDQEAKRMPS
jgi:hypothetical protein